MTDSQASRRRSQLSKGPLIGGAVLMGVGGLLGLAGAVLAGAALAAAARQRIRQMERPPSEVAKQNWARAKAATAAGMGAWRNEQPANQPQST